MKTILLFLVLCTFPLFTACQSESANLTTTAQSDNAMVDNSANITDGQTVTATTVPASTTVLGITGNDVKLSVPASATGTVPAKFKNTVAMQFAIDKTNAVAYGQTLGNMLQVGIGDVAKAAPTLAALTSEANTLASAWGMTPVNSSQQATFDSVLANINKVGANAGAISTFLTGLQTTGTL